MRRILLLIVFALTVMTSFGQGNEANVSLQIGYNFSNINPTQYNIALDSFNVVNNGQLSDARWGSGLTGALALHRGRASFRVQGRLFSTQSNAVNIVSGEELRTDISLYGGHISVDLTSKLLDIGRYTGIYVGAGVSGNYFETATATVPLEEYERDDPLTATTQDWRVGFKLHIPYRVVIPKAHVGFSLEPYFVVFFSNVDVAPFSEAINGPLERTFSDSMDHFGISGSIMIFLR
ncbi:MAG: hypothetical protein MRZ79_09395 [Bacteroidia bacterium]|nr:hypothetical protein [Bacteroidia bacterium]